jgi:hypothetical protein
MKAFEQKHILDNQIAAADHGTVNDLVNSIDPTVLSDNQHKPFQTMQASVGSSRQPTKSSVVKHLAVNLHALQDLLDKNPSIRGLELSKLASALQANVTPAAEQCADATGFKDELGYQQLWAPRWRLASLWMAFIAIIAIVAIISMMAVVELRACVAVIKILDPRFACADWAGLDCSAPSGVSDKYSIGTAASLLTNCPRTCAVRRHPQTTPLFLPVHYRPTPVMELIPHSEPGSRYVRQMVRRSKWVPSAYVPRFQGGRAATPQST